MGVEIERRFLVRDPCAAMGKGAVSSSYITQGYFGCIDGLRIRVRILKDKHDACRAFLTFKGARRGICRLEFEYPLALVRARRALDTLPSMQVVRKIRYQVPYRDSLVWTVDQFEGPNSGLVLAEIELAHPSQEVELPPWVGEEVTFNPRYGNSRLARAPMSIHLADAA